MDSNIQGNKGEDFVNKIAYESFLKYWCYPNPKFENDNKKEICDLLIIFQEVCLIISVKNYNFKGNHSRYFNNTVEKALKQINGAYKTLFKRDNVEIKHPDKEIETFPKERFSSIHKVIVNLGENLNFYEITRTISNDNIINIFDKDSFETILTELDTIPDFIDYLEKREKLFNSKNAKILYPSDQVNLNKQDQEYFKRNLDNSINIHGTEKDLLSYFINNKRNFPEELSKSSFKPIMLDIVGAWEKYKFSERTIKKDLENRFSYFIDKFIEKEVLVSNHPDKEEIAKELLSLDRLKRRAIGKDFYGFYEKIKKVKNEMLTRRFSGHDGLGIIFFNYGNVYGREILSNLFQMIFECYAYYYKYNYKTFIIIYMNKNRDFIFNIYPNYDKFSVEVEEAIASNIQELEWFTDYEERTIITHEFPD